MTARAGHPRKKKMEAARILYSLAPGIGKFPGLCFSESGEQKVPSLTVRGRAAIYPLATLDDTREHTLNASAS